MIRFFFHHLHLLCVALLLTSFVFSMTTTAQERTTVRIGVLAYQGEETGKSTFEPTRRQLTENISDTEFILVPLQLPAIAHHVQNKMIDFIISSPGNYFDLESHFGVSRLATLEAPAIASPTSALGSVLIVRADNDTIHTLTDLKGKTLAITSDSAFGGFIVLWREMDDVHLSPFNDLKKLLEVGFPMERVLDTVRTQKADAGVVRTCLLETLIAEEKIAPSEFRVVNEHNVPDFSCKTSSRLYPNWAFGKLPHTSDTLSKKVALALLQMPLSEGQTWTVPQDYSSVAAIYKQLRIGPFAYSLKSAAFEVLQTYWFVLLLLGGALLWWGLHSARVELLVRKRTQQLENEIEKREKAETIARTHREERDFFSRLSIIGEMAGNIAHEINQPLSAIVNYANGVERFLAARKISDPAILEGVRQIIAQSERASGTITRIRSFVKKTKHIEERIPLDDIIDESLHLFRSFLGRKAITLTYYKPQERIVITADRLEIEQVLLNLLQNSADSISDSNTENGHIGITVDTDDDSVSVRVSDNGTGVTEAVRTQLFDAFFTTKPQGLGLGLSICRTIIERHGGSLSTLVGQNEPGLTVIFTLPKHTEEKTP